MSDDTDPKAVRHLRPTDMPPGWPGAVIEIAESDVEGMRLPAVLTGLQRLREPFPPELVEKLPKPMWKDAWKEDGGRDKPKGRCDECGGYHCLSNTIHLDYIGHAGVTSRLLEVDPFWDWEPLAFTPEGLPFFDKFGGLWIKLTVCGITRLGYGDAVGKTAGTTAVKEIIGDAIRNAAMRFGVALDLWSKIDRHENKNPGATTPEPARQTSSNRRRSNSTGTTRADRQGGEVAQVDPPPRAENQDALDGLGSVCNEYGYSNQYCIDRFAREHGKHIRQGTPDEIYALSEKLIEEAGSAGGQPADNDDGGAGVGEVAGDNGEGTGATDPWTPPSDEPLF